MDALLALIVDHKWPAVAAFVIGAIVRLLKSDTPLPTIPGPLRSWAALILGAASGVLEHVASGTAWKEALFGGLTSALGAMAGHDLLIDGLRKGKELPLPGIAKGSNVVLFVVWPALAASIAAMACSGTQPLLSAPDKLQPLIAQYGKPAVLAGQFLCADRYARKRRISFEEAKETACAAVDFLRPFVEAAAAASERGSRKAGL